MGGRSRSCLRAHVCSSPFLFMMVFSSPSFSGGSSPPALPDVAGWVSDFIFADDAQQRKLFGSRCVSVCSRKDRVSLAGASSALSTSLRLSPQALELARPAFMSQLATDELFHPGRVS